MTEEKIEPAAWMYHGTGTIAVYKGVEVRTLKPVEERPSNSAFPLFREKDIRGLINDPENTSWEDPEDCENCGAGGGMLCSFHSGVKRERERLRRELAAVDEAGNPDEGGRE